MDAALDEADPEGAQVELLVHERPEDGPAGILMMNNDFSDISDLI